MRGTRPQVPFKIGYKNFYLYSAVDSSDGSSFNLILPKVDTANMNIFLDELSKKYPQDKIAIIMDGASWHKSKGLQVPSNILFFYFPPYSPELNPVERLWLYVKKNILANRVYQQLSELELKLYEFMKQLDRNVIKDICTLKYVNI